jgi:plasmid stabilization system protein ParE
MVDRVELHSGARQDFDEAFHWYAKRSFGAAIGFVAAVDDSISRVLKDPERFAVLAPRCRVCQLRGFPFRLVYRVGSSSIVVIAIAHAKRRPGYWRDRA